MTATMNANTSPLSPSAWMLSLALHGAVALVLGLLAYSANLASRDQPKVIELVAGPGDDISSLAAPAAGDPKSVKLAIPDQPAPAQVAPTPPAPRVEPQPAAPIVPAPVAPPIKKEAPKVTKAPPVTKEPDPAKNIAKDIARTVANAQRKAKQEVARERKKEQERLSKEEFDRKMAATGKKTASATPTKTQPGKFKPIDTKGIANGVIDGSSASKTGSGGKVLTREEGTLLQQYDAEFLLKLRRAFEEDRPPGLSDSLKVTVEVRSNLDGSLTNPRVLESSGSQEFDRAVLAALRRVRMGPRPVKNSETISFVFTMRED
jgi:colicin import membrane protein